MNYKNWTVKADPEIIGGFNFYRGTSPDGQKLQSTFNIFEAFEIIDEAEANTITEVDILRDQLRLARQCIEACREEFVYRLNKSEEKELKHDPIATSLAKLCTTALSNLPTFDVSPEAKNIDEVLKKISE
jgi:hypothetical protein